MSSSQWNSLEIAKLIASLATPVVVALLGLWINRVLQERGDRRRTDDIERSEKFHRRNDPHIELSLGCQFHGLRRGVHLVTIDVVASNRGEVLQNFDRISLRVRGIKDEPFILDSETGRVDFPHTIVPTRNIVPAKWKFVFIEPAVTQHLPVTVPIPAEYSYLLVLVTFKYKEFWPHTCQAVFTVPATDYNTSNAGLGADHVESITDQVVM